MYKTLIKKVSLILLSTACVAGMFATVHADQGINIDEEFTDENFRKIVKERLDGDGDGYLTQSDCDSISELDIHKKGIKSLKGIEYFTHITRLYCENNKIKTLDLTANKGITYLNCSDNELTELNISTLKNLETLECQGNKLNALDITNSTELYYVLCNTNNFTWLDISKCPGLLVTYTDGERAEYGYKGVQFYSYQYENNRLNLDKTVELITGLADVDGIVFDLDDASNNEEELRIRCGNKAETSVAGAGDQTATWKSSDKNIAIVDADGNIVAKKAGLVKITVTCGNKTAVRTIRVLYKDLTDASTFWYTPTYYLTDLGVVKGYDNQTKFKAANNCTRAQMVTFIWRLMGCPEPTTSNCKFGDVKKTDYFYKACLWGNENHIVEGYKDDTFRPQTICDRRHAVTFLWRLAGCPEPSSTVNKFEDVKESDYYYKPTLWASELKILEGYGDGTFRPDNHCLRRQMTTFLYKYDKYVNGNG